MATPSKVDLNDLDKILTFMSNQQHMISLRVIRFEKSLARVEIKLDRLKSLLEVDPCSTEAFHIEADDTAEKEL